MDNYELAAVFARIGDMLEVRGDAVYQVLAYREAARQLEATNEDVNQLAAEGRLTEIHGVGKAISAKIEELLQTGQLQYYERLRAEIPETLVELLQIPGLGPKKIKLLHASLGVASMDDLRRVLQEGKARELPGMGEKTEQKLLAEIDRWQDRNRRTPIGDARPAAEEVVRQLQARSPDAAEVQPAGSLRRWCDTIGDVDFVCASTNPESVLDCFVSLPIVKEVIGRGPTKASILTHQNQQMDLRVVPPDSYGAALQYFTGSKAHNVKIRTLAQRKGLTLNEYDLADVATGQRIASRTEADVYRALGLAYVPPEMREDLGEIELAARDALPRLVEAADIRGELHSHTEWSDGHHTIAHMAESAAARGLEYLAITDHSQSLAMVRGLTPERVREQWTEIDAWNAAGNKPHLLKGVELEILPDGTLDFPDDLLAGFDLVVASVHSAFRMDRAAMTERMLSAVRNPNVDVIGHATGRIIGRRDPYEIDLEKILRTAAQSGVAVEINSNPARLDIDWQHARLARDLGVLVPIDTDAHYDDNFELLRYGVAQARRAWLGPEHVLNTKPLDDLLKWLRARN